MQTKVRSIVFVTLLLFLGFGCSNQTNEGTIDGISQATAKRYRENEIQEYQGARLDPAIGPRDNSIKGVQNVALEDYSLKLTGLVNDELSLTYDDILDLEDHARKITLYCVEDWDATILWEGVLLEDIIDLAGINPEAKTVIFHSVDEYTTSLPLDTVINKQLILAHSANGLTLPPEMGFPFIVVAEEKLGYKWARWVDEIELSSDENYRGYWEKRGYNNDADL